MNKEKFLEEVGTVLVKLRSQKGENQDKIAEAIKMDKATYWRTENNKREMTVGELFLLADHYEMLPSTLVEMMQRKPAELDKVSQLQLEIEQLSKENAYLKGKITEEIKNI